ncbi:hypothetical protein F2P81_003130 [Scophthalmus maximus]|uniref:LIM zinc-binding domain-containing protein n=1 Tax=Scophthalmus maximus TaxID=52904 RepID=A0A6A4TPQ5_SCOMX|nr:hypothetical protein F2P81_003130 [Scophthalmus maximus]
MCERGELSRRLLEELIASGQRDFYLGLTFVTKPATLLEGKADPPEPRFSVFLCLTNSYESLTLKGCIALRLQERSATLAVGREHRQITLSPPATSEHPNVRASAMASKCPKCDKTVYFAEKVSSLGKDWHKMCLKCDRCNKLLNAGGHAEHDGRPYCHKPCYAALFGPKGVNIGGAGSYVYETPANNNPTGLDAVTKAEEKRVFAPKAPSKAGGITTFSGEANLCPRCQKKVYFAEKVTSLGKDWHRPCLRCERCSKTLTAGSHAEETPQRASTSGIPTVDSLLRRKTSNPIRHVYTFKHFKCRCCQTLKSYVRMFVARFM